MYLDDCWTSQVFRRMRSSVWNSVLSGAFIFVVFFVTFCTFENTAFSILSIQQKLYFATTRFAKACRSNANTTLGAVKPHEYTS